MIRPIDIGSCGDLAMSWSKRVVLAAMLVAAHAFGVPTAPSDDRFAAGEALSIKVHLDSASFLNGGYPIDSAGYAELPVVGRIAVAGKSRMEVEEYLAGKLANYLRDTHIKAEPALRLTLLGYWGRQGQYYISPKSTVWEAVLAGGGMGGERTVFEIKVLRGDEVLDVSFLDEYSSGRTLAAAGIRSGDIFLMPEPRDNAGGWYWFREYLNVTAQIATVVSTFLTVYITYTLLDEQQNQ